ncbi:MAG: hypothetical protein P8X74_23955 [Reinekea sp.]
MTIHEERHIIALYQIRGVYPGNPRIAAVKDNNSMERSLCIGFPFESEKSRERHRIKRLYHPETLPGQLHKSTFPYELLQSNNFGEHFQLSGENLFARLESSAKWAAGVSVMADLLWASMVIIKRCL